MMKRTLLFFLLCLPLCLPAQIMINELMPKNISTYRDAETNFSMWVELYNDSATSQALYDAYFTDDLEEPTKWRIGNLRILPKGYALFFFERPSLSRHVSFKLKPGGGVLYLLEKNGNIIDKVIYPPQYRNTSYGRVQDGAQEWSFFETPTPDAENQSQATKTSVCQAPVFSLAGGMYASKQTLTFESPQADEQIYYTTDGSEPSRQSIPYEQGTMISLSRTTVIRAQTFSSEKLPSELVTVTYLIGERNFNLPVVSVVSDPLHLWDAMYGIYVGGKNGTGNYCDPSPKNYNRPWDRPANFELFDTEKQCCLNQELDIAISGGCTRYNGLKSLKIQPRKKFGNNHLEYDFFPNAKPGHPYKDILLRNSSNDFHHSMMRDGFAQTVVGKRMDLDYMAYQPAVFFLNGQYYGIENIRERHNKDFLYSNYGLDEDEIIMEEYSYDSFPRGKDYQELYYFIQKADMQDPDFFEELSAKIDVENYIHYNIAEIYSGNTDWPHNNYQMWKRRDGGKWRWILFDLDFTYGWYDVTQNTLAHALWEGNSWSKASTVMFARLMENERFRNRFIDNMCVQIGETFRPARLNAIADSLAAQIADEIVYHKAKWGSNATLESEVNRIKDYAAKRPEVILNQLSTRYLNNVGWSPLQLSANIKEASYYLNEAYVMDADMTMNYYRNRPVEIKANPVPGYVFDCWEVFGASKKQVLFDMGSVWRYYAGNSSPSNYWYMNTYDDSAWQRGQAQFGYGNKGERTVISYGNSASKYTTSYYRRHFTISSLDDKKDFQLSLLVDDGAVVYVNGKELGRYNMPAGTIRYSTFSTRYSNSGDRYTINIPFNMLNEGDNVLAVEVHQCDLTSSDVVFDMSLTYQSAQLAERYASDCYSTTNIKDGLCLKAVYRPSETTLDPIRQQTETILYPTLVDHSFTLLRAEGQNIRLYDIKGKLLYTAAVEAEKCTISMDAYPPGMYAVQVGKQLFKLIKK